MTATALPRGDIAAPVRVQPARSPRSGIRSAVAVGSGVLLGFSFPPYGGWILAFPALAALALVLRGRSPRAGAWLGWLHGVAFFLVLLPWLRVIGVDAWIGLTLLESLFFLPAGAALALVTRLPAWPLPFAAVWIAEEAARARLPFGGFPWGNLAFGQTATPLTPLAAIGGAPLVGFATALLGAALAAALLHLRRQPVRVLAVLVLAALVPAAAAWVSVPTGGSRVVTVALVQGNVPRLGMDFDSQRRAVLDNHAAATRRLAADVAAGRVPAPRLVIWPENSSDLDPFTQPDAYAAIDGAVKAIGVPTLVGTIVDGPDADHVSNSGIVWDPVTGPGQRYVKRHPVPFGEYIPLRATLSRIVTRLQRIPRDFARGSRPGVLDLGDVRIADVICFEIAYDGLVRDAVRGGGTVLVVQTNNATYGRTGQPQQQLAMSRLRAVEHGRAVLIAATSGISAVISPDGHVVARTTEFTQRELVAAVPLRSQQTVSDRLGAAPEWTLAGLGGLSVLLALGLGRRHERRRHD